ncbi:MAG: glycoside hydrolase family 16 protein [Leeuwenhoekiella sp.]
MKEIKYLFFMLVVSISMVHCQEDDASLSKIETPVNLAIDFTIQGVDDANPNGDGSGVVDFKANADNAISYKFIFPDATESVVSSGEMTKRFTTPGLNTYNVLVVASGTGGISTTGTTELEVQSNFTDTIAVGFLTGGNSKTWYWAASEPGHLGVGANSDDATQNYFPNFYQAVPFEKSVEGESACLYTDELTFILNDDGETLNYTLNNNGSTFFNASYESVAGGGMGFDFCYSYDTSGLRTVNLSPSESVVVANDVPSQTTGTTMNFTDNGFMGYYIGSSSYEILSITENRMVVRSIPGNDSSLAWYHTFTTTPVDDQGDGGGEDLEPPVYDNLVWSDEFDIPGAPNPDNWSYDLGTGNSGWGNNESQYYTDRTDNIIVEDGFLKITAQREDFMGSEFTSSRILTQDKQEFTYGRMEIRAKLPQGGGTWPAIWMLGANFEEVGWPTTGEIDIMEHVGNAPTEVLSTLHFPGNSGGNGVTQSVEVAGVEEEFHIYRLIWGPENLFFYVDDNLYHTFDNREDLPFNKDFFFILNVAMGGNLGGNIDPAYTSGQMEVDYVRVYQ